VGGFVLGDADYAKRLLADRPIDREEQTEVRRLERHRRAAWDDIVRATEELRGRKWPELLTAYGEWGRDGAIYVAVRFGGLRLAEVLPSIPGLKYQAAAQGVKRFREQIPRNPDRSRFVEEMRRRLSKI
jgi:hypothetical protein